MSEEASTTATAQQQGEGNDTNNGKDVEANGKEASDVGVTNESETSKPAATSTTAEKTKPSSAPTNDDGGRPAPSSSSPSLPIQELYEHTLWTGHRILSSSISDSTSLSQLTTMLSQLHEYVVSGYIYLLQGDFVVLCFVGSNIFLGFLIQHMSSDLLLLMDQYPTELLQPIADMHQEVINDRQPFRIVIQYDIARSIVGDGPFFLFRW